MIHEPLNKQISSQIGSNSSLLGEQDNTYSTEVLTLDHTFNQYLLQIAKG